MHSPDRILPATPRPWMDVCIIVLYRRPCLDLVHSISPSERTSAIGLARRRNVSVIRYLNFKPRKSIGDTLSLHFFKSIDDNTIDIRKVAAILDTSILTSLVDRSLIYFFDNEHQPHQEDKT